MKAKYIILTLTGLVLLSCQEKVDHYERKFNAANAPKVTTNNMEKISAGYIIANGTIDLSSPTPIMEKGFLISTTQDFTEETTRTIAVESDEAGFSTTIYDLQSETDYYIKSYGINTGGGIGYGEVKTFKTKKSVVAYSLKESDGSTAWQAAGFLLIDKDGDGENWMLDYWDEGSTRPVMISYSYGDSGALTPENYLILPAVSITGVDGIFSVKVRALDANYPKEKFKLVVSDSPITADNCRDAKVLLTHTLANGNPYTATGALPSEYDGKNVYLGIAHFETTDWYALCATEFTVTYAE